MIELRFLGDRLQYRVQILWQWTDWRDVPVVEERAADSVKMPPVLSLVSK